MHPQEVIYSHSAGRRFCSDYVISGQSERKAIGVNFRSRVDRDPDQFILTWISSDHFVISSSN